MDSERIKLVGEYYLALRSYRDAIRRLHGLLGTEFAEAYRLAEEARLACEVCRVALTELDGNDTIR